MAKCSIFICILLLKLVLSCDFDADLNWLTCKNENFDNGQSIDTAEDATIIELFNTKGRIHYNTFAKLPHIKDLTLFFSNLDSIDKGALCRSQEVEAITIGRSEKFPKVTNDMFYGCQHLKQIRFLQNEGLSFGEEAFKNLPHLESLVIHNNTLQHPNWNEFGYLESLKVLDLSMNSLCNVDIFYLLHNMPNLKRLKLDGNDLPCKDLVELKNFLWRQNNIEVKIEDDTGHKRCT